MHVKYGVLAIGLTAWLMLGTSEGSSAIQWEPSLDRAQVLAAHTNRLVLVHFWGNGCPPCARMDREVFTRQDVAGAVARDFVAVKLNNSQSPGVARQLGVDRVPTDVIMTPQGQVLAKFVGMAPADQFVGRLSEVAQNHPRPGSGPRAMQSANGIAGPMQHGPPQPGQGPHGYGAGPAPNSTTPPGMAQNPAGPANQAMAATAGPRYSGQPPMAPGSTPPNPYAVNPQTPPNPQASAGMMARQPEYGGFAGAQPGIQQRPPQNQPAVSNGNPPLALDGYCAVSLERSMRLDPEAKWTPGNPAWGALHEGRTYLFAGPQEQQVFLKNPNLYAPVLSCNDVVAKVESGRQIPGVRKFGARWNGRVYLFGSQENFDKFQANPTYYETEILGPQQRTETARQPSNPRMGAMAQPGYRY